MVFFRFFVAFKQLIFQKGFGCNNYDNLIFEKNNNSNFRDITSLIKGKLKGAKIAGFIGSLSFFFFSITKYFPKNRNSIASSRNQNWKPENHRIYPKKFKDQILCLMLLRKVKNCVFSSVPKLLLYQIIRLT